MPSRSSGFRGGSSRSSSSRSSSSHRSSFRSSSHSSSRTGFRGTGPRSHSSSSSYVPRPHHFRRFPHMVRPVGAAPGKPEPSFACPTCGAPLDYAGDGSETLLCPYCASTTTVPVNLRTQRAEPVDPEVAQTLQAAAPQLRTLADLVRTKQRDQAIALYQQIYQTSATDAPMLVDELMGGSPTVLFETPSTPIDGNVVLFLGCLFLFLVSAPALFGIFMALVAALAGQ